MHPLGCRVLVTSCSLKTLFYVHRSDLLPLMICDENSAPLLFLSLPVVVGMIDLSFKEFYRETEAGVTLWQCPPDPCCTLHLSERLEWKPFKSSMATPQASICVVGVMLGFGENSSNKILTVLVYCKDWFRSKE